MACLASRFNKCQPLKHPVLPLLFALSLACLAGCGTHEATAPLGPSVLVTYLATWGSEGTATGQFELPKGIATDAAGSVYVADSYNQRIQKFDQNGHFLIGWGKEGADPGDFESPWALAVGADGNVYVTDRNNHRVEVFDSRGGFVDQWGSWGLANGHYSHPRGLAIDMQGRIYVAEGYLASDNNRIQVTTNRGGFLESWGHFGRELGQFDFTAGLNEAAHPLGPASSTAVWRRAEPDAFSFLGRGPGRGPGGGLRGIAVDAENEVLVADMGNNRVQLFDVTGRLRRSWGSFGTGRGEFVLPQGIACDRRGLVAVSDGSETGRIQIFDLAGHYLTEFGSLGAEPGRFNRQPVGLAFDGQGHLYVTDTGNSRVEKFLIEDRRRL